MSIGYIIPVSLSLLMNFCATANLLKPEERNLEYCMKNKIKSWFTRWWQMRLADAECFTFGELYLGAWFCVVLACCKLFPPVLVVFLWIFFFQFLVSLFAKAYQAKACAK